MTLPLPVPRIHSVVVVGRIRTEVEVFSRETSLMNWWWVRGVCVIQVLSQVVREGGWTVVVVFDKKENVGSSVDYHGGRRSRDRGEYVVRQSVEWRKCVRHMNERHWHGKRKWTTGGCEPSHQLRIRLKGETEGYKDFVLHLGEETRGVVDPYEVTVTVKEQDKKVIWTLINTRPWYIIHGHTRIKICVLRHICTASHSRSIT